MRIPQFSGKMDEFEDVMFSEWHDVAARYIKNMEDVMKGSNSLSKNQNNAVKRLLSGIKLWVLRLIFSPPVKFILKKLAKMAKGIFPSFYERILFPLKLKLKRKKANQIVSAENLGRNMGAAAGEGNGLAWAGEKRIPFVTKPLVSIIVLNSNHARFLRERLDSIYNQTYQNYEVILLDDGSTDDSREILMQYANRYPDKTITDFNDVNSGKAFEQWNRGIEHAQGQLIWIAESDDWCDLNFLEKMVPQFEYQSVMLAFSRSVFMQDGQQIWTSEEYLSDIPELDLQKPFILSAHNAVRIAFGIKNMIPNVSSAVFRNTGKIPHEITDIWEGIQLCGEWLFYLHTIRGGCISYTNQTTSYYRIQKDRASLLTQKSLAYYQEQEQVSKYIMGHFDVDPHIFERVLKNLERHHKEVYKDDDLTFVHENYNIARIIAERENRLPNVLMCCFSIQIGGGETYPIVLANELRRQGVAVSFLNFNLADYSPQVRSMLNPAVPVINLESTDSIGRIICQTGAEIAHSHHGSVDHMVSIWLQGMNGTCKQVVTLHGMYETMEKEDCIFTLDDLVHTCKQFIYIADKNLTVLKELGFFEKMNLVKIGNGLPKMEVTPVKRESLGIGEEDFVLCIVSRALPEKGWQEATNAVIEANKRSSRRIHLILVGEGEMRERLAHLESPFIHVVGQKSNVRDYYAASDMGLLPSRFKGESYPLTVIESLLTGKPVIATDIGEVRHQLTDSKGELAGILLELNNWTIDEAELTDAILSVAAKDSELYSKLKSRVKDASEKFDITRIVKQHIEIYQRCAKADSRDAANRAVCPEA